MIASISGERPYRETGMIAFVREVIFRSISSTEIVKVSGSISANTGIAFAKSTHIFVLLIVSAGTITSSPSPTPADSNAA